MADSLRIAYISCYFGQFLFIKYFVVRKLIVSTSWTRIVWKQDTPKTPLPKTVW